jgi:hypothetical protein
MANTQITITENGTKTLKTAGKYCDRDIDVNVNVASGSGGITPTGTIEITENGTHDVANYATAVVDVPSSTPTQFTNVLTHESTELLFNQTYSGTARNGAICVIVDLVSLGITTAQTVEFRMRGLTIDLGNPSIKGSADKTTWSSRKSTSNPAIDDHGDFLIAVSANPAAYPYLLFPFRNSDSEVTIDNYAGAILTINEPIGNGGYVG